MLSVLARYPPDCAPRAWTKAASGFSGAEVYRLETARGTLALRRWPAEHPSPERLAWIHSVLTQAVANGFDRLPLPIRTLNFAITGSAGRPASSSDTFVAYDGHLWELAPWLPGAADFRQNPSPVRLTAATQALAQLHVALADSQSTSPRPSPGLRARLEQLRRLRFGAAVAIRAAISSTPQTSNLMPQVSPPRDTGGLLSSASPLTSGLSPQVCSPSGGPDPIGVPQAQEVSLESSSLAPLRNSDPSGRFATRTGSVPPGQDPQASSLSPQACSPGATGSASALPPLASGLTPPALASTLFASALEILAHFERVAPDLERQLAAAADRPVPLQPALRDIHDEHVLFVGEQVSGIIDFGALREETVAGDVARLLGSLVGGPRHGLSIGISEPDRGLGPGSRVADATNRPLTWQAGLNAYESVRPLSDTERVLVPLFDQSGLLLGAMNWLEWLFVDGRQFTDLARVHARVNAILSRLRA